MSGDTPVLAFSPQQVAFLDWAARGSGSCVLEAVAGAGKTTAIIEAVQRMRGQVAICAYNKKIADEVKDKLQKRGLTWKKAQAGTVHSEDEGRRDEGCRYHRCSDRARLDPN